MAVLQMGVPSFEEQAKGILGKLSKDKMKYNAFKFSLHGSRSFKEIFAVLLDFQETNELKVPTNLRPEKDGGLSDRLRRQGTEHFKKKEYIDALDRYNLSILHAPHPVIKSKEELASPSTSASEQLHSGPRIAPEKYGGVSDDQSQALAMGYANRSAVLMQLKMYQKCVQDIDLALSFSCPESFRKILEERRRKCLKIQERNRSQVVVPGAPPSPLKEETVMLSNDFLRLSLLSGNQQLVDAVMNIDFKAAENQAWKNLLSISEEEPPIITQPNPNIPALNHCLEVVYHPAKGRHIIATRYFRPGEVLAVESAYCASLYEGSILTYCSSCVCFCMVPLPCPGCSKVVFCSEICRYKYLEEEHWLECAVRPSIIAFGLQNRNLAYKLFKSFTFHHLLAELNELQNEKPESPEKFGFDKDGVYNSTSYHAIHYLQTHKEITSFETIYTASMLALAYTKLLHLSNKFFVDVSGEPFEPSREDVVTTGAVILSHVLKIHNNCLVIYNEKLQKPIGSAIFSALSLVNHDCSPSAFAYHRGRNRVLRALKPIFPGEEITTTYSMAFHEQERKSRRENLQTLGFTCNCLACEKKWPIFSKLPIYELKSDINIPRQDALNRISNAVVLSYKIRNKVNNNEQVLKEEYESLCQATEMMYRYVADPCQNICNLQLALAMCFIMGF